MSTRPTLSVVIPHYGDPTGTNSLLDRLEGATSTEIIVVDDASPVPFPDRAGVWVVRRARNGGFGAAVNSGVSVATGDLLAILNSDLAVDSAFLDRWITAAEPWQPCISAPRLVEKNAVAPSARAFPRTFHQVAEWLTPLARMRSTRTWHVAVGHDVRTIESAGPATADWLVGAALLLPRDAFNAIGGFDERFHMNSEEVDLQRRLRALGLPSVYLPGVVAKHEGGGSSDPGQRRRWLVDSRLEYVQKWGGHGRLRAALSVATAVNLAWNVGRHASGRRSAPVGTARAEWNLIWKSPE